MARLIPVCTEAPTRHPENAGMRIELHDALVQELAMKLLGTAAVAN